MADGHASHAACAFVRTGELRLHRTRQKDASAIQTWNAILLFGRGHQPGAVHNRAEKAQTLERADAGCNFRTAWNAANRHHLSKGVRGQCCGPVRHYGSVSIEDAALPGTR